VKISWRIRTRAVRARRFNEARAVVVPHKLAVNCSTTIRSTFVASNFAASEKRNAKVVGVQINRRRVFALRTKPERVMCQPERQTAKSFANVWFVNYYSYPGRD